MNRKTCALVLNTAMAASVMTACDNKEQAMTQNDELKRLERKRDELVNLVCDMLQFLRNTDSDCDFKLSLEKSVGQFCEATVRYIDFQDATREEASRYIRLVRFWTNHLAVYTLDYVEQDTMDSYVYRITRLCDEIYKILHT